MTEHKEQRSAEERALVRFPAVGSVGNEATDTFLNTSRLFERSGYNTAIREEVEPLEAEVARLKALVGEATILLRHMRSFSKVPSYQHVIYADDGSIMCEKDRVHDQTDELLEDLTKLSKEGA